MANTDPFSSSVIPFEVPEQMRALAEKGVSQARDSYAKFKDAAETHNGTIEAVFTSASKGASAYNAKLIEFFKANTTSSLDFAQELFGVKTPAAAMELWPSHAKNHNDTLTAPAKQLPPPPHTLPTHTANPLNCPSKTSTLGETPETHSPSLETMGKHRRSKRERARVACLV